MFDKTIPRDSIQVKYDNLLSDNQLMKGNKSNQIISKQNLQLTLVKVSFREI